MYQGRGGVGAFCCRGNKPWEVECAFAFEQKPNFVCVVFKCCIDVFLFSGWSAQWPNSDSVLQGLQPRCTGPGDCQRRGGADDAVWGLPASHWHLSSVGTLSFLLLFHSCLVWRIWVHVMISVSTVVFTMTTHLAGWLGQKCCSFQTHCSSTNTVIVPWEKRGDGVGEGEERLEFLRLDNCNVYYSGWCLTIAFSMWIFSETKNIVRLVHVRACVWGGLCQKVLPVTPLFVDLQWSSWLIICFTVWPNL